MYAIENSQSCQTDICSTVLQTNYTMLISKRKKKTLTYRDVIKFWKLVSHPGQWLSTLGSPDVIQVAQNKEIINYPLINKNFKIFNFVFSKNKMGPLTSVVNAGQ